uniref:Uncharacterized protein n=1 Tax=Firmicutes phage HS10 TaxID=3056392 RepID=A0AA49X4B9_9VIRU|nr:MAG: hypothetical protein [Firmicutes phage HS10]
MHQNKINASPRGSQSLVFCVKNGKMKERKENGENFQNC